MASTNKPFYLTRAQVREIDRRSVEQYHIPSIILMENAARGAVDVLMQMLPKPDACVLIVCGAGNNGGDGLAIARHLRNFNVPVEIATHSERFTGDALINWNIIQAMKVKTFPAEAATDRIGKGHADILVDALFGTGLSRAPDGTSAALIGRMNDSGLSILAIDVPSGLDCDTGKPLGPCVRATQTVTFVAEKVGFAHPAAKTFLGKVTVVGIGCPIELIEAVRTT